MGEKIEYQRMFFILKQEDAGYGTNQDPSGYVKIEVRDDKGKMTIAVQNLKEDIERFGYKAYILKADGKDFAHALIGNISIQMNKGELFWDFNPHNIGMKNFSIADFSAVVIVLNFKSLGNNSIVCPLIAYKDKKVQWREQFTNANIKIRGISVEVDKLEPTVSESKEATNLAQFDFPDLKAENTSNIQGDPKYFPQDSDKKVESCVYKDKKLCASEGGIIKNNPCANCFMNADNKIDTKETGGVVNLEKLRENLTKCFEVYNPFGSRRKDYIWWKISNPAFLNNILYQCNIRTPLLFNPKVMLAHFKYRYIIFGMYNDSVRHREYIVCGIPGVYNTDDKPFGDMCKWVQLEGNRPRVGAFGYWLVYAEPKTGKLINVN